MWDRHIPSHKWQYFNILYQLSWGNIRFNDWVKDFVLFWFVCGKLLLSGWFNVRHTEILSVWVSKQFCRFRCNYRLLQ